MDSAAAALEALAAEENAGLVMDFDGALSLTTDDPNAGQLLPGTAEILGSLASRLSVVALLSGRPAGFLGERAAIPGVELHGSYGLEQCTGNSIDVVPEAQPWLPAVRQAAGRLHRELDGIDGVDGVCVEDTSLAVAVHWRDAPDRGSAAGLITPLIRETAHRYGLIRESGKFVEELRVPLDQDKGTALRRIISTRNLLFAAYAGDDRSDLPAFEAAAAAGGYTLVVDGPDTAAEVSRIPGAHFDGPGDFQLWLRQLNDAMS